MCVWRNTNNKDDLGIWTTVTIILACRCRSALKFHNNTRNHELIKHNFTSCAVVAKNWATTSPLYPPLLRLLQTHQSTRVATSKLLRSLPTVSLSPSLWNHFPLMYLIVHHYNIDYSSAALNWFHWTVGLMIGAAGGRLWPAALIFFLRYFCWFFSLGQESFFEPREAPTKTFWHLPRLPDGIKARRVWGVCVCVSTCAHCLRRCTT